MENLEKFSVLGRSKQGLNITGYCGRLWQFGIQWWARKLTGLACVVLPLCWRVRCVALVRLRWTPEGDGSVSQDAKPGETVSKVLLLRAVWERWHVLYCSAPYLYCIGSLLYTHALRSFDWTLPQRTTAIPNRVLFYQILDVCFNALFRSIIFLNLDTPPLSFIFSNYWLIMN